MLTTAVPEQAFGSTPWNYTTGAHSTTRSGASSLAGTLPCLPAKTALTLLVPNVKRNYNQAASGRRERSEYTYLRGAFGRLQSEEGYSAHVQYLRDRNSYSVLLAHFHNDGFEQDVTLAHVFWLTDAVRKFHVVATRPLTIQEHLTGFETNNDLKKQLRQTKGFTAEDQFNKYSQQFRKLFGLRSDKALDLFNQTVTIKEIGQLNDFIRQHMLEKTDAQEKIGKLQEHYENLMLAYQAMQKAELVPQPTTC